jgi:hypothetical protein
MKTAVFWFVAPCSMVKFNNVSEVLAASVIRAISPESSVNVYQTTRRNNPEDRHIFPILFKESESALPCP